jgi:hypothetical protein
MRSTFATALVLLGLWAAAGHAQTATPASPAASEAAVAVITRQIEAFKADDGALAYSLAAPEVQMKFPSVEIFMGMVRQGYPQVYRPQSYAFAPAEEIGGNILQKVDIVTADGEAWVAEYSLRADADGVMRITGCRILKAPGIGA